MAAVESVISTAANIFLSMGSYMEKQFWGAIEGAARKAGTGPRGDAVCVSEAIFAKSRQYH